MMPHATMEPVALMPSTGLLHLALGSFDPLLGSGPEVPKVPRTNDAAYTGMVMLQLDTPNGAVLERLVKQYDLTLWTCCTMRVAGSPTSRSSLTVGAGGRGGSLGRPTSTRVARGTNPPHPAGGRRRPRYHSYTGFGLWRLCGVGDRHRPIWSARGLVRRMDVLRNG